MFLQPDANGSVTEYRTLLDKDSPRESLQSGNVVENTPSETDTWHKFANGETNTYTLFIPAEKLRGLAGRSFAPLSSSTIPRHTTATASAAD